MKKLVAFGAIVFAIGCVGCGSPEETAVLQPGDTAAKPAGSIKPGGVPANTPGDMGGPQLTEAGAKMQAGSKLK